MIKWWLRRTKQRRTGSGQSGQSGVIAVGEGVTRFSVGDKVFGQGLPYPDYAGFQEYCKLKVDYTAKDQYANQPILIIGGPSSVGQFVIQLAKASGFSPIITTASLKHTEKLKALGATHIIDRTIPLGTIQPRIAEIIASTSEGSVGANDGLINHIFDTISEQETQSAAYDLLAPGGVLSLVLPPLVPTDSQNKSVLATVGLPHLPGNTAGAKALYATVTSLVENGTVKPSTVEVVPGGPGAVVDGLKRLENNQVSGVKLVVRPSEIV